MGQALELNSLGLMLREENSSGCGILKHAPFGSPSIAIDLPLLGDIPSRRTPEATVELDAPPTGRA